VHFASGNSLILEGTELDYTVLRKAQDLVSNFGFGINAVREYQFYRTRFSKENTYFSSSKSRSMYE
jgi:hypothetical protein